MNKADAEPPLANASTQQLILNVPQDPMTETEASTVDSAAPAANGNPDKAPAGKDDKRFPFAVTQLQAVFDPKNKAELQKLAPSIPDLLRGLDVDAGVGLHADEDALTTATAASTTAATTAQPSFFARLKNVLYAPVAMAGDTGSHAFPVRSQKYGRNVLPAAKSATIFDLMLEAMKDKILILLSVAALVSLAIGLYEDFGPSHKAGDPQVNWIEGVAILVAVSIVVLVGSINDWKKEKQFRALNAKKDDRKVRAIRDGQNTMISIYDVQVGDLLSLEPGDMIGVDGVLISAHNLKCDESSATGESDLIRKTAYSSSDDCKDPFILSGSKVSEGVGKFVVCAVGQNSYFGKTLMGLRVTVDDTPLQKKLDGLAEIIAKLGAAISLLLLIVLLIKYLVSESIDGTWPEGAEIGHEITTIFIQAIIIVVVAVPEGLPLAVTLALAYATSRMLKDNNLVRVLASCETMGGATTICSDKTGTLTQNKMTVVAGLIGLKIEFQEDKGIEKLRDRLAGDQKVPQLVRAHVLNKEMTPAEYWHLLVDGVALNSTAFEEKNDEGVMQFIGSKTEMALLDWIKKLGTPHYPQIRSDAAQMVVQMYPFSSERKSMSAVVKRFAADGSITYRIYSKGASEIVLKFCENAVNWDAQRKDFTVVPISSEIRTHINQSITGFANKALRTIILGYRDMDAAEFRSVVGEQVFNELESHSANSGAASASQYEIPAATSTALEKHGQEHLTMLALVGIEDPLREGVIEAVAKCQTAGVFVRMVTGDNINTAKAIASKCGILTKGGVAMEGSRFRKLRQDDMDAILPRLQVLARSSPTDKQILVRRLKELGETVAVTGDGTNDGPALKMADVGFSMGIAGTEVAKEASSIVLMDDNFSSILKAMMWGRCVNDSVKKFLQFQLTVNVSAVLIAFISSVASSENQSVLGAVQLLWINLIMDTLAALALATDPPTEELLNRYPESKRSPLITVAMWKMILGQAVFQVVAALVCLSIGPSLFSLDMTKKEEARQLRTFVFNTFVMFQIFNEFNCRRIDSNLNFLTGITKNTFFGVIMVVVIIAQALIIQYGGYAFDTVPITGYQWLASIIVGALTIPIGVIIRLFPTWDGCTLAGVSVAVPDNERIIMTKERLQWQHTIGQVRTQISVFRALRGTTRHGSSSQDSCVDGSINSYGSSAMEMGGMSASTAGAGALSPTTGVGAGVGGRTSFGEVAKRVLGESLERVDEDVKPSATIMDKEVLN